MKYRSILAAMLAALLFTLTACAGTPAARPADAPVQTEPAPAAQPEAAEPEPAEEDAVWTLYPAEVTDEYLTETVVCLPELALSSLGFTFDSPSELTSQQLYLLFLAWSAQEELDACYDEAGGTYVFDAAMICRTLDRYLEGYRFAASNCLQYDAGKDAIVTPMAGGFGGWLDVQLENKAFNGNTLALTALLDGSVRKVYTVTFYDGGYRYQSVRQLSQPEARPVCSGSIRTADWSIMRNFPCCPATCPPGTRNNCSGAEDLTGRPQAGAAGRRFAVDAVHQVFLPILAAPADGTERKIENADALPEFRIRGAAPAVHQRLLADPSVGKAGDPPLFLVQVRFAAVQQLHAGHNFAVPADKDGVPADKRADMLLYRPGAGRKAAHSADGDIRPLVEHIRPGYRRAGDHMADVQLVDLKAVGKRIDLRQLADILRRDDKGHAQTHICSGPRFVERLQIREDAVEAAAGLDGLIDRLLKAVHGDPQLGKSRVQKRAAALGREQRSVRQEGDLLPLRQRGDHAADVWMEQRLSHSAEKDLLHAPERRKLLRERMEPRKLHVPGRLADPAVPEADRAVEVAQGRRLKIDLFRQVSLIAVLPQIIHRLFSVQILPSCFTGKNAPWKPQGAFFILYLLTASASGSRP